MGKSKVITEKQRLKYCHKYFDFAEYDEHYRFINQLIHGTSDFDLINSVLNRRYGTTLIYHANDNDNTGFDDRVAEDFDPGYELWKECEKEECEHFMTFGYDVPLQVDKLPRGFNIVFYRFHIVWNMELDVGWIEMASLMIGDTDEMQFWILSAFFPLAPYYCRKIPISDESSAIHPDIK